MIEKHPGSADSPGKPVASSADSREEPGEAFADDSAHAFEGHLTIQADSKLQARAAAGHSPSIRLLVNASDDVVALAELVSSEPPTPLRARVLASLGSGAAPPHAGTAGLFPSASEASGVMHRQVDGEAERLARVAELPAEGPDSAVDRALDVVLGQLHPFFDFEIVIVSVVTAQHTVHRVSRGLLGDGSLRVVPREISFCTHTVSAGEPFVVEDGAREAFFRGSTVVHGLGVRSYVGVPVFSGNQVVGLLCALSRRPHEVTAHDVALMAEFARLVMGLLGGTRTPARVYESSIMTALIDAQRARLRATPGADPTTLFRGPGDLLVHGDLSEHLVVGEADGGDGVVLLVPANHPAFAQLSRDPRVTSEPLA